MARRKADYDGLMVQEFLSKAQAMAYTNYTDEKKFDEEVRPYMHVYRNGDKRSKGDYFLPELRQWKLDHVEMNPTMK